LDEGKTGFIDFGVFVEWWRGRRPSQAAKEQASRSAEQSS
jgi:hypothetical protein